MKYLRDVKEKTNTQSEGELTMFLKFNQKVIALLSLTALTIPIGVGVVMQHPNSALAQERTICSCIRSEAQPQRGQKARSSGNFSTEGCSTTLVWELPDGINVDIAQDISGGKDRGFYRVSNGVRRQNPNKRSLYIANPHGAQQGFQVCAINTQ